MPSQVIIFSHAQIIEQRKKKMEIQKKKRITFGGDMRKHFSIQKNITV